MTTQAPTTEVTTVTTTQAPTTQATTVATTQVSTTQAVTTVATSAVTTQTNAGNAQNSDANAAVNAQNGQVTSASDAKEAKVPGAQVKSEHAETLPNTGTTSNNTLVAAVVAIVAGFGTIFGFKKAKEEK